MTMYIYSVTQEEKVSVGQNSSKRSLSLTRSFPLCVLCLQVLRKFLLVPCIRSLTQVSCSPAYFPSQALGKVPSTGSSCCRLSAVIVHLQAAAHAEPCRGIGCMGTNRNSKRKCQEKFT